jgi:hypothetical protein
MAYNRLAFDRVAIAPSTRTAIIAPIPCNAVTFEQTDQVNAAKVWDSSVGGSYKELPAGTERIFEATHDAYSNGGNVFRVGDVVAYVEAVAGTGPIAVEFLL